MSCKLSCLLSW